MISEWSARHDTVFGREILGCELWKYRPDGTRERGNFLDEICEILNNIEEPQFCISQKSLRDHLNILESDATKREAERGSGTSSKYHEIDQMVERREEEETKLTNKSTDVRSKHSQDKIAGEELRERVMEHLAQTRKRNGKDKPRKKRLKSNETLDVLRY